MTQQITKVNKKEVKVYVGELIIALVYLDRGWLRGLFWPAVQPIRICYLELAPKLVVIIGSYEPHVDVRLLAQIGPTFKGKKTTNFALCNLDNF